MYDPNDPRLQEELRHRTGAPYGPDAKGGELLRSIIGLGIIVAVVLGGLWLAGA